MRPKSLILIVIALGCGLVASIGVSQVMDRRSSTSNFPTLEIEKIVVSMQEINVGQVIDAKFVRLEEWPKDKIPKGALTKLEDVEGERPRQRVFAGEPLLQAKLIGRDEMVTDASRRIRNGFRAVTVKVSADTAVAGLLRPGDTVDVLAYLRRSADIPMTTMKTILQNVHVFAIDDKMDRLEDDDGKSINVKTVTLEVEPAQVEILSLANELGKIRFSARRPGDTTAGSDGGAAPADLLTGRGSVNHPPSIDQEAGDVPPWLDQLAQHGGQDEPREVADDALHYITILRPDGVQRYEVPESGGRIPRRVHDSFGSSGGSFLLGNAHDGDSDDDNGNH